MARKKAGPNEAELLSRPAIRVDVFPVLCHTVVTGIIFTMSFASFTGDITTKAFLCSMKDNAVMDAEPVLLITEDNDDHFLLTKKYLEQKGITKRIVRFTDGRSLLDFFAAIEAFDLPLQGTYVLLLDIDIPKVTGTDVLRRIRRSTRLKDLPVIILTAVADRRTIDRCYQLGCSAFFTKPLQGNDLVDVLKSLSIHLPAGPTS